MIADALVQPDAPSSKLTPEEIHLLLHGNPDDVAVPSDLVGLAAWNALYSSTSLPPVGTASSVGASGILGASGISGASGTSGTSGGVGGSGWPTADGQTVRETRPRRARAIPRVRTRSRRSSRLEVC